MKTLFSRFNNWYDSIKEPWRFLFFLFVLMGWIPVVCIPSLYPIGITWMIITVCIALSR